MLGGLLACCTCGSTASQTSALSPGDSGPGPDGGSPITDGAATVTDGDATYQKPPPPPPDPCIEAGTCPPGQWVNVTPQTVNLGGDFGCGGCNYGVQDIKVDPVYPNVLFAFICYQGVWKSTDYGLTWKHVSTGQNAAHIESGRPWTAAIDPNPHRDPSTDPTLYTVDGYGDRLGVYKSTNGGVDWTYAAPNNTTGQPSSDVYSLDVDPYDSSHLVAGFHDVGLSESKDGGSSWRTVPVPGGMGISVYIWFVQTGSAATSSTWLTEAQWGNNTNGMWRTTDAGAHWSQVNGALEHGHGSAQIYQDGKGDIWAAGNGGNGVIFRSTDFGVTWSPVNNGNVPQNGVFGSPNYVYATFPAAVQGTTDQHLQRSPTSDGVNWSDWPPIAPQGMTDGAKSGAVTFDGTHYVIVTGNWLAGIWRYVE